MTANDFYEELEMADLLKMKITTLRKNRSLAFNHPPCIKLGTRWVYMKKDFQKWVNSLPLEVEKRRHG